MSHRNRRAVSRKLIVGGGCLALAAVCVGSAIEAARPQAERAPVQTTAAPTTPVQTAVVQPSAARYRAVLDKYCVTCHNDRRRVASLALDKVDISKLDHDAEIWEKVIGKLRGLDMPPAGSPRPDEATYDEFASWLENSLDAITTAHPNPGRPTLHRLNRTEYVNAIRDLIALDIDAAELLPADNSTYGFDNIADALSVSPLLLESYVAAARKISRAAVGDLSIPPVSATYRSVYDETQDYHEDGLPFGTRGGLRVRHHFPVDGEYELRIRLERSVTRGVRGLQEPHDIELLLDGERIKTFTVDGGPHMYAQRDYDADSPSTYADDAFHVRVPVKAGPHEIVATFPAKTFALTDELTRPLLRSFPTTTSVTGVPGVSRIVVTGPYDATGSGDTPSRNRIFSCRPSQSVDETGCAKKIISALTRRAYRGMATDGDIQDLLAFYKTERQRDGFEGGIESVLWRILASPKFIFRFEFDPPASPATAGAGGGVHRISDFELASRLSFFLWSSIPDEELLDTAARGELKNPAVLERQVRRMLADSRATALVQNFAGQWLFLRNVDGAKPDSTAFPNFDNNLRKAFRTETELFFEAIVRDDRSVVNLLDADFTFVNERLARHYGIPGVRGSRFRRVTVTDENRRGLLGQGSILTVTSYANRTSPVLRGKWILETILGSPPPPPPPDVPDLPEEGTTKGLSMRERMVQHRKNPVCASCHSKMEPLGFALENFDAVGAWRVVQGDDRSPIDASGNLPNGTAFDGPAGLRKALMQHPDVFVRTMTSKLLVYALGRGLEVPDRPAIRGIVRDARARDYTFSSLVLGIVKSVPFQMRRAVEAGAPAPSVAEADRSTLGARK